MTATMRGTTSDETTRANARASAANTTMKNAVCICSRIMCWTVAAGVLSVDGGARLMVYSVESIQYVIRSARARRSKA